MIDLYYWTTPNGHKITIFLEETGLPYTVKPVNISDGRAVRAGVPRDLAEQPHSGDRRSRAGRRRRAAVADRVGRDPRVPRRRRRAGSCRATSAARWECLQWLYWQMGGLGPMAGQNHHFTLYALEKIPYAIDRYVRETGRLYAVLNKRLADRAFIAGDYSIADIACYPWVQPERQKQDIDGVSASRALEGARSRARPAVQRAYALAKTINVKPAVDDEKSRAILFGQSKDTVTLGPVPGKPRRRNERRMPMELPHNAFKRAIRDGKSADRIVVEPVVELHGRGDRRRRLRLDPARHRALAQRSRIGADAGAGRRGLPDEHDRAGAVERHGHDQALSRHRHPDAADPVRVLGAGGEGRGRASRGIRRPACAASRARRARRASDASRTTPSARTRSSACWCRWSTSLHAEQLERLGVRRRASSPATQANLHAAITRRSPRFRAVHGGAAENVIRMAQEIGDAAMGRRFVEGSARKEAVWARHVRAGAEDPRARTCAAEVVASRARWVSEVVQPSSAGRRDEVHTLATARRQRDFCSYHGIAEDLFVPVFAVGRRARLDGAGAGADGEQHPDPAADALQRPRAARLRADRRALSRLAALREHDGRGRDDVLDARAAREVAHRRANPCRIGPTARAPPRCWLSL